VATRAGLAGSRSAFESMFTLDVDWRFAYEYETISVCVCNQSDPIGWFTQN